MGERLRTVPVTWKEAKAFVAKVHRHHPAVHAHRFSTGVEDEAMQLRGVAVMGRPVARLIDQRRVLEVTRVATDGCPNACSALYGQACRIGKAHGFRYCQTYTLGWEPGTSLIAAGWKPVAIVRPQRRSRPSRPRADGLVAAKVRWECRHSPNPAIQLQPSLPVAEAQREEKSDG